MALSKNQIKLITSLALKKNRDVSSLFVAEGNKLVADLLPLFGCELIAATDEWIAENKGLILSVKPAAVVAASKEEIKKASAQNAPQSVIAVLRKREACFSEDMLAGSLTLMLDTVQDPGNLGTIIRIADWFGIDQGNWKKRLALTVPMLAIGAVICHIDYSIVWRYFSWSNQTLAMIALWAASVYLAQQKKNAWLTAIPATFMSAVSATG